MGLLFKIKARWLLTATALTTVIILVAFLRNQQTEPLRTKADTGPYFTTWESLGDPPGEFPAATVESLPPESTRPWAGTVSHHLLAHNSIDRWFTELAQRRTVETFYVLSPSHWGLSSQPWSITDGTWLTANGRVRSNRKQAEAISRELGVPFEHPVFEPEHGISTLMPYIARHFPGATVVAMAYRGEPPLNQARAQLLTDVLGSNFDREGKERNFLLISADFAHHGDPEGTVEKDTRTRIFFDNPGPDTWIFAGCDNRPGMYLLAQVLVPESRCAVVFHTDSWKLSGRDAHDITSYFFTFFWDEEKGRR